MPRTAAPSFVMLRWALPGSANTSNSWTPCPAFAICTGTADKLEFRKAADVPVMRASPVNAAPPTSHTGH
eukprot:5015534-Prymnesium_polylepis.2